VPRPGRPAPNSFSADWPEAPCDDPTAEVARRLVVRLKAVLAGRSLRSLKDATGVDHTTVSVILSGQVWPDIATLARLEAGLDADLWPGRLRPAQHETVGQ
jgi:transcriptional regulator with XRE-family HTH domain